MLEGKTAVITGDGSETGVETATRFFPRAPGGCFVFVTLYLAFLNYILTLDWI